MEGRKMKLSADNAKLFYQLWLPLLNYVNRNYHILVNEIDFTKGKIDLQDAAEVSHFLWERTWIIDDYLNEANLPEEHKEILRGWKRRIRGKFIIERHLKKGSVFISTDDNSVYLVNGIVSSWEEMLHGAPVPIILRATLLPFKGVIITDGLVSVYPIMFGSNSRAEFKETYMDAKRNGKIKTMI
jgi:hypothetical protein